MIMAETHKLTPSNGNGWMRNPASAPADGNSVIPIFADRWQPR
jgi:hypothetical protein